MTIELPEAVLPCGIVYEVWDVAGVLQLYQQGKAPEGGKLLGVIKDVPASMLNRGPK